MPTPLAGVPYPYPQQAAPAGQSQMTYPAGFNASHFGPPDKNGIMPFNSLGQQQASAPSQANLPTPQAQVGSQQPQQGTSSTGHALLGGLGSFINQGGAGGLSGLGGDIGAAGGGTGGAQLLGSLLGLL